MMLHGKIRCVVLLGYYFAHERRPLLMLFTFGDIWRVYVVHYYHFALAASLKLLCFWRQFIVLNTRTSLYIDRILFGPQSTWLLRRDVGKLRLVDLIIVSISMSIVFNRFRFMASRINIMSLWLISLLSTAVLHYKVLIKICIMQGSMVLIYD